MTVALSRGALIRVTHCPALVVTRRGRLGEPGPHLLAAGLPSSTTTSSGAQVQRRTGLPALPVQPFVREAEVAQAVGLQARLPEAGGGAPPRFPA